MKLVKFANQFSPTAVSLICEHSKQLLLTGLNLHCHRFKKRPRESGDSF